MSSLFHLRGRVAVIAGGTSGLGQAIECGLESFGASVIAAERRITYRLRNGHRRLTVPGTAAAYGLPAGDAAAGYEF